MTQGAQSSHRGPQFNQTVPVSPGEFTFSPNSTPAGDSIQCPFRRAPRTPKAGKSAKGTHASCSGLGHQPLREPPQRLGVCPQADTEALWADRAPLSPGSLGEGQMMLEGKVQGPRVRKGGHLPGPQAGEFNSVQVNESSLLVIPVFVHLISLPHTQGGYHCHPKNHP